MLIRIVNHSKNLKLSIKGKELTLKISKNLENGFLDLESMKPTLNSSKYLTGNREKLIFMSKQRNQEIGMLTN